MNHTTKGARDKGQGNKHQRGIRQRLAWREQLEAPKFDSLVGINKNLIHYGAIVRLGQDYGAPAIDGVWRLYHHARKIKSRSFKLESRYEGLKILGWPRNYYDEFKKTLKAIHRRTFVVKEWYQPGRARKKKRRVKIGRVRRGSDGSVRITFTEEFWRINDTKMNEGYVAFVPVVGLTKLKTIAEKVMLMFVSAITLPVMSAETWMRKLGLRHEYEKRSRSRLEAIVKKVEPVYGKPLVLAADRVGNIAVAKLRRGDVLASIDPTTGGVADDESDVVSRKFQETVAKVKEGASA